MSLTNKRKADVFDVYVWICSSCNRDNVRCYPEGVKPLPMFREPCDHCGATLWH